MLIINFYPVIFLAMGYAAGRFHGFLKRRKR